MSSKQPNSDRRRMLAAGLALVGGGAVFARLLASAQTGEPQRSDAPQGQEVSIENFSAEGKSLGVAKVAKIVKSDGQWRSQLSALSFEVTRQEGTERPYSGEYAANHADGIYNCICCDTALFDSKTKFESGTGWPSFWKPISTFNVIQKSDSSFGMQRDAISCRRCDAHLGHVFDDGPRPTGLRYCMNSVSLHFAPRA